MKCITIVVIMAVVCAAKAAVYGEWPYGAPWGGYYSAWPTAYAGNPKIATYSSYYQPGNMGSLTVAATNYPQAAAPVAYAGNPGMATSSSYSPAGNSVSPNLPATTYPQAAPPARGATYTAKTLGAVHIAPLPGHVLSQTSLNVAPAPGTW